MSDFEAKTVLSEAVSDDGDGDTVRCVKVKSDKNVLLKIFLNKATCDCFINLSPIFTTFNFLVNNHIVHMAHHFGCH